MLVAAMQAYAGIYLVYGEQSGNPVAVIDDQTDAEVLDEGYLAPRAHAYVAYASGSTALRGSTRLPLAFIPPVTAYAVGGYTVGGYAVGGYAPYPVIYMAAPTATNSPQLSRVIQGGHAWSAYQSGNNASGLGLVYAPSYGSGSSSAQRSARGNRARAQAFRLDYYK
ncbi:MAG: hypothetical protein PHP85_04650 [Gallionella sp.]|nr:hypothetical protein [Gallionella sp.]